MTPEEKRIIQQNLEEVAQILYNNTPDSQLQDFENVELSVREHLMQTVAPTLDTSIFPRLDTKKQQTTNKSLLYVPNSVWNWISGVLLSATKNQMLNFSVGVSKRNIYAF